MGRIRIHICGPFEVGITCSYLEILRQQYHITRVGPLLVHRTSHRNTYALTSWNLKSPWIWSVTDNELNPSFVYFSDRTFKYRITFGYIVVEVWR